MEAIWSNRWWIYQRERFPLLGHAPLVAAFSFSAVAYASLLRGEVVLPHFSTWLVAFLTSLAFFLQLRIADEFKDFDEDSRYRPYRPVPRGLIKLRELGVLGAALALLQLVLALWLFPPLVIVLVATWIYLALMSHEFFLREWLKARPITYLWTHMLIMPLIDLYATACDWMVAAGTLSHAAMPGGLFWFLIVSFFNGIVIEIGRKIRSPEDEEEGVETYSVLWGRKRAVVVWLGALLITAMSATFAAWQIDFMVPVLIVLLLLLATAGVAGWYFLRHLTAGAGKRFELIAGVWTLSMYISLGAGPLLWKV
ncbi:MAG: UbiA family prenyltransferase [Candidatus Thiodiazotropha endolucinida]